MATKSILKTIVVDNKKDCELLISTLERAEQIAKPEKPLSKNYKPITKDVINKIFKKTA
ncbi:hypothetical protein [Megamonas hypermegale]|uniref:hypothetical protein n=1 Tax=Megamonas hypermegale TaxID=158847 RepID=UPI0026EE8FFA|nr:hypothetical protein [Megamonas hypermegale]